MEAQLLLGYKRTQSSRQKVPFVFFVLHHDNLLRLLLVCGSELKLMLIFCIPTVWPPPDDEESALKTYTCPPSPGQLASATHPTNCNREESVAYNPGGKALSCPFILFH